MIKYFSAQASFMSDFSQAYENLRGENLISPGPYIINLIFGNTICVSQVLVQVTAPNRKPSNVAKIQISYKAANGSVLTTADGKTTLVLTSPDNDPTVNETSPRCNVKGIDVTILNTTDKAAPAFVRLKVMGCDGSCKSF